MRTLRISPFEHIRAAQAFAARLLTPDRIQTTKANEELLRIHVDELTGANRPRAFFRNPENIRDLNDSADYIISVFQRLGLDVEIDEFRVPGLDSIFRNIRVSFGPKEGERFIIGAHYDVYKSTPGADDNASGVAGLLELARLMVENKINPKTPVDLIAYTLEENPYSLLGSRVHATQLKKAGVKVKGMISLEMIGYFSDEPESQSLPLKLMKLIYPTMGNFILVGGYGNSFSLAQKVSTLMKNHGGIPSHKLWIPYSSLLPDIKRSDHASFSDLGYPAVIVTDTSFNRNPNYHKDTDGPETLSFPKMAKVVDGIFGLIKSL
jgi:hypothetical protein